ncbi:MAG TPA: GNAT family N-acetyltransferase [Roseiarcus sp.]|jgi:RimJ/RimL family protein N-acetyltransferase|nr:GNAT family N-acetyltransferase [Roseiarcus sp.]
MTVETNAPEPFALRQLQPGDATTYRALRLQGLRDSPEAFAASFDDESQRPLAWFCERLQSRTVYGGFLEGDRLAGLAGLRVESAAKLAHIGVLWGMFVEPEDRRRGLGKALARRIIDGAQGMVEQIHLSVVSSNHAAIKLYAATGFKQYGLERRALKVEGRYHDEILMALWLGQGR